MSCRQHPGPLMSQLSLLGCGSSGSGFAGSFDSLSAGVFAAVSSRRLFSTFMGSSPMRMREQPGTTEADIAFAADYQDVSASERTSLLGSNDGRIVTAYDQTGLGSRDFTQSTAASQPKTKDSGTVVTVNGHQAMCGVSGASGVLLATAASVAHGIGTGDFLVSAIIKRAGVDSNGPPVWGIGSASPQLIGESRGFPSTPVALYINGAIRHFDTTLTLGQTYVITWTRESGVCKCYINGVAEATTHSHSTSITSDRIVLLGERTGGTWSGPDILNEIIFATSVTNRAAIIAAQMTYAGL